ncbi:MAG: hypothetical protein SFZ24_11705, partial [Planctomycetota bacterium]|nr:hypothetical protein [Planctomycetota bacterium]
MILSVTDSPATTGRVAAPAVLRPRLAATLLALALAAAPPGLGPSPASAHPIPESERWATVTHPGNQPYMHP